ncbi:MAG: branched-chain amino acid ABC transporter permease [Ignavibacteriales bacterium]|nr:branched-chain amino acid ABC transporter permease [Ignavibacteriales bacterium]
MELIISLLTKSGIYAIFILSLNNIVMGKTGYWAVGHLALFAFGALITGIMTVILGISGIFVYLAFVISIFFSGILSLIPAISTLRIRGDFFIFISITLSEIVRVGAEYIAGPSGFSNISRPLGLSSDSSLMYFTLLIFLIAALYSYSMKKHPLKNISILARVAESSALSFGINVYNLRIKMFILGGMLAGMSGSLFAFYSNGTDPQRFNINEAIMLFALAILGGVDSIRGTIIATILYVITIFVLESLFRGPFGIYAPRLVSIFFGILLIFSINFMPKGIMGKRSI